MANGPYENKIGRPVPVDVNYLKINASKIVSQVFHYDLTFKPPGPKKFIVKALEVFRLKFFKKFAFAFDGSKNVYTDKELPLKGEMNETVEITSEENDTRKYEIKMQLAAGNPIDMSILKE